MTTSTRTKTADRIPTDRRHDLNERRVLSKKKRRLRVEHLDDRPGETERVDELARLLEFARVEFASAGRPSTTCSVFESLLTAARRTWDGTVPLREHEFPCAVRTGSKRSGVGKSTWWLHAEWIASHGWTRKRAGDRYTSTSASWRIIAQVPDLATLQGLGDPNRTPQWDTQLHPMSITPLHPMSISSKAAVATYGSADSVPLGSSIHLRPPTLADECPDVWWGRSAKKAAYDQTAWVAGVTAAEVAARLGRSDVTVMKHLRWLRDSAGLLDSRRSGRRTVWVRRRSRRRTHLARAAEATRSIGKAHRAVRRHDEERVKHRRGLERMRTARGGASHEAMLQRVQELLADTQRRRRS